MKNLTTDYTDDTDRVISFAFPHPRNPRSDLGSVRRRRELLEKAHRFARLWTTKKFTADSADGADAEMMNPGLLFPSA